MGGCSGLLWATGQGSQSVWATDNGTLSLYGLLGKVVCLRKGHSEILRVAAEKVIQSPCRL